MSDLIEEAEIRLETGRHISGRQLYIADDESLIRRLAAALEATERELDSLRGLRDECESIVFAPGIEEQVKRIAAQYHESACAFRLRAEAAEAKIAAVNEIISEHTGYMLRRAAKFGRDKPDCICEVCQTWAALQESEGE